VRRAALLLPFLLPAGLAAGSGDDAELFERRVRPVLVETCFKCHGGTKTSGELRVDSLEALVKGGKSGPAIVPGKPEASPLLRAIRHEADDFKMPPKQKLPQATIDAFAKWIAAGAPWPKATKPVSEGAGKHWAFQPVRKPDAGGIDELLAGSRAKAGVRTVALADRRTLIRRAFFDLHGLPPEPDRVEAFARDERPDAFARLVDELLASPRTGERWGRHWLDLARYADTAGDDSDYPVPQARLYRDWVIDAFNRDLPYDQFLREQLAGDLLARDAPSERYADLVVATGFIAQAKRFATHKHEDMHLIIEDTINTLGQSVLGLTIGCARCHDHKYDPLTSSDYYALYGFFQSAVYPHPGSEEEHKPSEFIPLVPPAELKRREDAYQALHGPRIRSLEESVRAIDLGELAWRVGELKRELDRLKNSPDRARFDDAKKEHAALSKALADESKPVQDELAAIRAESPMGKAPLAYAMKEGKPADAKIQVGGEPRRTGATVPRGVPKVLHPAGAIGISNGTSGRLELAQWITDPANPLTARVMANRIWQQHFGQPIVPTPSNFGFQGEPPTQPELLDWLAATFIEDGWSIKSMHRRIMLSEAYRLSSADDRANAENDGANRNHWRYERRRMDAEALRDSMLAIGGNLDLNRPGPHPFPPSDKWNYSAHRQFKAVYPSNHRSVFLMVQRLHLHPYLSLFNGADTTAPTELRDPSTVPLQSLYVANSDFVHEQAAGLARRLAESADPRERVRQAYLRAFARPPTDAEVKRTVEYADRYAKLAAKEGVSAGQVEKEAWASVARVLFMSNEFLYVD
jgi:hypothetical protein